MKIHLDGASRSMLTHSNRYRWTDWGLTKLVVVVIKMAVRLKLSMKKWRGMYWAVESYVNVSLVQIIGDRHISDEFTDTNKLWIKWIEKTSLKLHSNKVKLFNYSFVSISKPFAHIAIGILGSFLYYSSITLSLVHQQILTTVIRGTKWMLAT